MGNPFLHLKIPKIVQKGVHAKNGPSSKLAQFEEITQFASGLAQFEIILEISAHILDMVMILCFLLKIYRGGSHFKFKKLEKLSNLGECCNFFSKFVNPVDPGSFDLHFDFASLEVAEAPHHFLVLGGVIELVAGLNQRWRWDGIGIYFRGMRYPIQWLTLACMISNRPAGG